jgi:tetratricopeptide (TPR) repeat protein
VDFDLTGEQEVSISHDESVRKYNGSVKQLTAMLRAALADRRISEGIGLLQKSRGVVQKSTKTAEFAELVGQIAQWVDVGFDQPELIHHLTQRFDSRDRNKLPLIAYAHLRMAEGMVLMTQEVPDRAIEQFDFVLNLGSDFADSQSLSIVHFWKARSLRKKGEYDAAMVCTSKARDTAMQTGSNRMAAVMRVLESWLWFRRAKSKEAIRILQDAESVLAETDDFATLGNIQSSYGRIASRAGNFDEALEHFTNALEYYKRREPRHRKLARTLTNMAQVERLLAERLSNRIDSEVERRRQTPGSAASETKLVTRDRARIQDLRRQALAHLNEAAAIYRRHPNHHGAGKMHLAYGELRLDDGDYESASAEVDRAFELGEEKSDAILMARARILGCMVAMARADDEIGDGADAGSHARRADMFIREAIELASRTQDRRLLATAYIRKGLTDVSQFFDNVDDARQAYDRALSCLRGADSRDLWDDLRNLKLRLLGRGSIDATLRAWSQGVLGDKSFQQVSDEFADLVIPKVWEREGRKVSRVASRLSISPKKVRRILSRVNRLKT